jgi:hypothetical protein
MNVLFISVCVGEFFNHQCLMLKLQSRCLTGFWIFDEKSETLLNSEINLKLKKTEQLPKMDINDNFYYQFIPTKKENKHL